VVPADVVRGMEVAEGVARKFGKTCLDIPAPWLAEALTLKHEGVVSGEGFRRVVEVFFKDRGIVVEK